MVFFINPHESKFVQGEAISSFSKNSNLGKVDCMLNECRPLGNFQIGKWGGGGGEYLWVPLPWGPRECPGSSRASRWAVSRRRAWGYCPWWPPWCRGQRWGERSARAAWPSSPGPEWPPGQARGSPCGQRCSAPPGKTGRYYNIKDEAYM